MDKQIQSEREQGLLDTQGSQEYYWWKTHINF
jgi:hypothetical protein